jgi:uncharacterized membrane protein YoaK (UPF0700 family)
VSAGADLDARTLPIVLGVIAGSTDVIGFLGLNGMFTARIAGNVVVPTAHLAVGRLRTCRNGERAC